MEECEIKNSKYLQITDKNTTSKKNSTRLIYIDIARGIAIILMILGHVCGGGWKRKIIFSFHMPLFIIISGMFFKENEKLKDFIIKILKKLIIPYVITIMAVYAIMFFIYNKPIDIEMFFKQIILAYSNKKTFFKDVSGVGVLWFIPFLIMCRAIFLLINKITKNDETLKLLVTVLITITGVFLAKIKIFLPWSFDVVLACIFFYYIGYALKKYNIIEKILNSNKMLIVIALIYIVSFQFGNIELAARLYPYGIMCYVTAISGTIIILKISKIIERFFKSIANILVFYGKNSMYILCFHYLEMSIIKYKDIGFTEKWKIAIAKLIIITVMTIIFTSIKKYIKEKKNETI